MTRYHIAKSGQPAVCKAQSDETCPLGGQHFSSKDSADFYLETVTPQQSAAQVAQKEGDPAVGGFDVLSDAEVARRLVLVTESWHDSDYDGSRNQFAILEKMKAAGYVSGDYTWDHGYLKAVWEKRPGGYISAPGYLDRTRRLKAPAPRTHAPAADPQFAPYFQENFSEQLDDAVTTLTAMHPEVTKQGVAPERRIKDKTSAVRHFRDQWGPRFAQIQSREELEDVLSEFDIARTRLDKNKWQEAGWDQGLDLARGYAEAYLRTPTSA